MDLEEVFHRANAAKRAANEILAAHELSPSRIIHLEDLLKRLSGEPVDVQVYFKEAIKCLELELYRPAIVMSWAGFFHCFMEAFFQKHEQKIRDKRGNWSFHDVSELKEATSESQLIETAKIIRFINKADARVLDGYLSKRNQCAHPTLYKPNMNEAIGYVDVMISRSLDLLIK